MEESRCLGCSEPIYFADLDEIGYREPDYDGPGSRIWRHANGYGACMTTRFATPRPPIVCLCGSTRFMDAFHKANLDLTMAGTIVLTVGCDTKSDDALELTGDDKAKLDELHKRKIDLADSILVLNVDGYIGASTTSEIEYAQAHGKAVEFLKAVAS